MQPSEDKQAIFIQRLESCRLPTDNSQKFAESLVEQFNKHHKLSDKQWYYVRDMVEKHYIRQEGDW